MAGSHTLQEFHRLAAEYRKHGHKVDVDEEQFLLFLNGNLAVGLSAARLQVGLWQEREPAQFSAEDLDNRFNFHPATDVTGPKHELVRTLLRESAQVLVEQVPAGRELARALTSRAEAMMWANAGIARSQ
jgi:hypothetical protein